MDPIPFQSLNKEQKIEFFTNCQKILITNHPNSEFLLTKENWLEKKDFALNFIKKYKGFAYWNNNICVLFNRFKIKDPAHPTKELKEHIYKESEEDYNCILIDFAAFDKMIHSLNFIKEQNNPKILYVIYVKNNEVKLYMKDKLLEKLNALPAHLFAFA